jgi:hypothetical protein
MSELGFFPFRWCSAKLNVLDQEFDLFPPLLVDLTKGIVVVLVRKSLKGLSM